MRLAWFNFMLVEGHTAEGIASMPACGIDWPECESDMDAIVSSPLSSEYRSLLMGKALVEGFAPEHVEGLLAGMAPAGLSWEECLSMPWLEVPVPVVNAETGKASLHWYLAGLLKGHRKHRVVKGSPKAGRRDHAVEHALEVARTSLGAGGGDTFFAAVPRHPSLEFDGDSLGLPIWLGAMTLARMQGLERKEAEQLRAAFGEILATGALDENGSLRLVDGVERKAALAGRRFSRFLYPASSTKGVPSKGFPLVFKEDAEFLLESVDERFWRAVYTFRFDPGSFWLQLPILGSWRGEENASRLSLALEYARNCGCWVLPRTEGLDTDVLLENLCSFLEKRDLRLKENRRRLLEVFPLDWVERQERTVNLFRLCQLQITYWNSRGRDISSWIAIVEECRNAVRNSGRNVSAMFLSYYARLNEGFHNKFIFRCPSAVKKGMWEELRPFAKCREQAAGEIYGMLCQGAAFRGYRKEALRLAALSEKKFGLDKEGRLEALRRDADRAHIHWDRKDGGFVELHEQACRHARRYIRKSKGCDVNYPYAEALKARIHAEAARRLGKPVPPRFLGEAVSHMEKRKQSGENGFINIHPWQLYFYNAGSACLSSGNRKQRELAIELLMYSRELCLHGDVAIECMALLSLSQLASAKGLEPEDELIAARVFQDMEAAVEGNRLDPQHFAPLLELAKQGRVLAALAAVRSDPQRFFPFNYR